MDMEYRYWAFIEAHPAHTSLPVNAKVEAMDVLTWAWTGKSVVVMVVIAMLIYVQIVYYPPNGQSLRHSLRKNVRSLCLYFVPLAMVR